MVVNNKELVVAIGYTISGERKDFKSSLYGALYCSDIDLISIEISEGVKEVYCYNNYLTELKLPDSVEYLNCYWNNIEELHIGENSMLKELYCEKQVKGLDTLIGNKNININLW